MNYIVFDLETTGLDRSKDHIIQFAAIKVDSNYKILDSLNLYIQPVGDYQIGIGAYLKHQINAKFLADKPHFADVANDILNFIGKPEDNAIITFSGTGFDIPFLVSEFQKVNIDFSFVDYKCYDAFLEEKRRNGISLENTYKRYKGKSMAESGLTAHDALSDVKATFSVFIAQQRNAPYEPETMFGDDNVLSLAEFKGEIKPCFNIGKYKGISLQFIKVYDPNYIDWCLSDKCNWSKSVKEYISDNI